MAQKTILVVEDEQDILNLISYNLHKDGFLTRGVATGEEALSVLAEEGLPDILILDLMLPGIAGFEVCRRLKADEKLRHIPVIMLTAKTEDSDIITGLEAGADDYVTKPFSPKVLTARVRAALRRSQESKPADKSIPISVNGIEINTGKHEVYCGGVRTELSATEFLILSYLAAHPGWVYSRSQIIAAIKGEDYPVTDRSIDVQILGIRKKLGEYGRFIETVRGIGYKMKEERISH